VAAYNSATKEESLLSTTPVSATTVPSMVSWPSSGGSAVAQSSSIIRVRWDKVSGIVDGYRVYRATSATGEYKEISTSTMPETTNTNIQYYDDTRLEPNTPYYYKVYAYNDSGDSPEQANYASATTKLAPPEVTAEELSNGDIKISWELVPGATGYRVYRSKTTSDVPTTGSAINNTTGTSYPDTNLPSGTYYYKVIAYNNSAGQSDPSSTVQVTK
jgi:fibronectin type 3 domain-containing protein